MASRISFTLLASWLRWEMEVLRGMEPEAVATELLPLGVEGGYLGEPSSSVVVVVVVCK
jgi:hypothetical protein